MAKKKNNSLVGRVLKDEDVQKYCLLAHLLSFEKIWTPYFFSEGVLYSKEVKEEAKKIVELFYEIYGSKEIVADDGRVIDVDKWTARQFIVSLDAWANSNQVYISEALNKEDIKESRIYYQVVLMQLESELIKELELPLKLTFSTTSHELLFRRNVIKWFGKIPMTVLYDMSEDYLKKMSETDTIVMVADVRRSQDLMTYGKSPETYRNKMIEFLKEIRKILLGNYAIYDQFTGDGFIAYFNEHICNSNKKDYYEMMIDACKRIIDFSNDFFKDWAKTLRRVPAEEIGLAIGVDSGRVYYSDLDDQFLAIGDACVWATRMSSAGDKGEVILNNIPYQIITGKGINNSCDEICSETKTGEEFKAFRLSLKNIKYTPDNQIKIEKPVAID